MDAVVILDIILNIDICLWVTILHLLRYVIMNTRCNNYRRQWWWDKLSLQSKASSLGGRFHVDNCLILNEGVLQYVAGCEAVSPLKSSRGGGGGGGGDSNTLFFLLTKNKVRLIYHKWARGVNVRPTSITSKQATTKRAKGGMFEPPNTPCIHACCHVCYIHVEEMILREEK